MYSDIKELGWGGCETDGRGRAQSRAQAARSVKAGQRPSCCYRTNHNDQLI